MLTKAQRAALSARVRAAQQPGEPSGIVARPAGATDLPLSHAQQQLWFLDRFAPGRPTYNVPGRLRLTGPLDVLALRSALATVIARHEALRTRFVAGPDGNPVQVIDPPPEPDVPVIELTGDDPAASLRQRCEQAAVLPFDLAGGPLLRTELLRISATEHVLVIVVHHIVFDAWSYGVLLRELTACYTAALTGAPAELAELPVQFADYALWERQRLATDGTQLIEFWQAALAGFESLQLPTDRPRPVLESFRGRIRRHRLGEQAAAGVAELARRQGSTGFVVLLAALQAMLSRYTGQHDIVVGTPSANRSRSRLQPLIGFLVNTLPIRTDLSGDPTFLELIERVRRGTVAGYAHQDLPLARLVEAIGVPRDPGRSPIFNVLLTSADEPEEVLAGGLRWQLERIDLPAAKFDLAFFAETCADGLWLEVSYASDLYDEATIDRMLGHYGELLTGALADPALPLSELPLLTEAELFDELVGWNSTETDFGPLPAAGCLHQLFQAQAASTPDAPAATMAGATISYRQLDQRSNQVARWLVRRGAGQQQLVGVAMQPSLDRLAVLLGILKAGGGYLPLDPALPVDRLSFMVGDAGARLVLTDQPDGPALPDVELVSIADLLAMLVDLDRGGLAATELGEPSRPDDVAYLMYTSGSTGQPKGVLVEHRQVVNFALGMIGQWQFGTADRVLQFASLSFDVSVLDMFCCLLAGSCAVLIDQATKLSPPALGAVLRAERVTTCCLPPVLLGLLADQDFPELRLLIAAGEQLPTELARQWLRPGLRLVNGYGPTETTVLSLSAEVDGRQWPAPIGSPLPNYQAYVLDPDLNPVPVGVPGQLHTGGAGVARGYLNRPELTAERFVDDPFSPLPDARLYRTGDLVKRLPDGRIEFLGRLDGQVKLRGLRVELGEIEAALARHPAVSQAVVLLGRDRAGAQQLTGYLVPAPGRPAPAGTELASELGRWLPAHMIPTRLVWLDGFPLNTSGKVDRRALAALVPADPAATDAGTHAGWQAPIGPTESALSVVFAELLGRDRVGAGQPFFELGGNSLQVMQLISRVRAEFGVQLPVSAVFLTPDVRGLAARIDELANSGDPAAGDGVVLQLAAGAEPLLLIHPVGGTVFGYQELAGTLAGRYRVLAVQAPALAGSPAEPAASLTELADRYLTELRAVQPRGPYRIGGWSMGGLLAHRITHLLERAGEQVRLLVLIDAPYAIAAAPTGDAELAAEFVTDALATLGHPAGPGHPAAPGDTVRPGAGPLAALLDVLSPDESDRSDLHAQLLQRLAVFSRHRQLMAGYRPRGEVVASTLLVAATRSPNLGAQQQWPELLTGNVLTASLDATHYSLLRAPVVDELAARIHAADPAG